MDKQLPSSTSSFEDSSNDDTPQTPVRKKVRLNAFVHKKVVADEEVDGRSLNTGAVKVSELSLINPNLLNKRSPLLLDHDHFMIPDGKVHPKLKGYTICMIPFCPYPAIKTLKGTTGLGVHLQSRHNICTQIANKVKKKKEGMREKEGATTVLSRLNPVRKLTSQERREKILVNIVDLVIEKNLPFDLCESPHFRDLSRTLAGTQSSPMFSGKTVREALRVKAALVREATTWALSTVDNVSLTMDHWTSCAGDTYSGMSICLI